jgi:hypothetical protein
MSARTSIDMYELLPTLYRLRDTEQGYPLRALLWIIGEQADIVKRDIDALWDDYFIETCADWVIPYIGDLVANNPLYEVTGRRADVAKTIYYRRRKGTLPMLEELARDVTGWGAHAVTFFELLGWTQNLNHLRYQIATDPENRDPYAVDRVGTLNLRSVDALDRLDGPFDAITHTVDVRPIGRTQGWYNIRKVGFFLWRLRRYPLAGISPRQADPPYGYHFSSLGNPAPLFTDPVRETDESGLAREVHVPGLISPAAFYFDTGAYYGPGRSVHIVIDGTPVAASDILCKDLRNWDQPPEGKVAVDVRLGRLAFREDERPDTVEVSYNYGFSADIGGGPYDRRRPLPVSGQAIRPDTVADPEALDSLLRVSSEEIGTIIEALDAWGNAGRPKAVIQIEDSRTYPEDTQPEDLTINVEGDDELVIQAENRQRPTLIGSVTVTGSSDQTRLTLNGLLIEGHVEVDGELGELAIEHCTLVPGRSLDEEGRPREPTQPSLIVGEANDRLRLVIHRSIVGPLRLPTEMIGLEVGDSILEGGRAEIRPALVSKNLSSLSLSSDEPTVHVTIGDEGPHRAVLRLPEGQAKPTSAAQVRDLLEQAIHDARESPAFRNVRVITPPDIERLIVLSGGTDAVIVDAAGEDHTASELSLDPTLARRVNALVGRPLPSFSGPSSGQPTMTLTMRDEGPYPIVLHEVESKPLDTVPRVRNSLQRAIRTAPGGGPAIGDALVGNLDDRLVVLPGTGGVIPSFGAPATDKTTMLELGLESGHPAIAASGDGERPGPQATLRRTTVFGAVYIRELSLASEVIFTAPVVAERRQAGCVRFSYVPKKSQTPRRYRCQPDLALTERVQELGLDPEENLSPLEEARVRARLQPSFTSIHYGAPGYAQLGLTAAEELRTGAEDGSEMGAFSHLKQPQREANLRIRLEEYLPFGLEAGLIYVT